MKILAYIGSFLLLACCLSAYANEKAVVAASSVQTVSYMPRVYLAGYAGSNLLGQGDAIAPVFLTANSNLFLYGRGRYDDANQPWENSTWAVNLGLGYRQIIANSIILGGYVLGDYAHATSGKSFRSIDPGVELLGNIWDVRVNGFIPISDKRWVDQGWADEFGDYRYVEFKGHTQYDHWYQYYQEIGWGGNAEVGLKLFSVFHTLVKGYLSGYYFSMQHNDAVRGAGARVTISPTGYLELSLNDAYDNYAHNVFVAGAKVSIYDLFNNNSSSKVLTNLHHRLFEPIENTQSAIDYGSNIPVTRSDNPEDQGKYTETTNIWFFRDDNATTGVGTTAGDGTFEHPFGADDFNLDVLAKLNKEAPNAKLYFSPGQYLTSTLPFAVTVGLYKGQSMWGRTADYKEPAVGNNRAMFNGALSLSGNNTLDSIRVNDTNGTAITVNTKAQNNNLSNDDIFEQVQDGTAFGIYMENNSSITVDNSVVTAIAKGSTYNFTFAQAISAAGQYNNITINNSIIKGEGIGGDSPKYSIDIGSGYGVVIGDTLQDVVHNNLTINNSTIVGYGYDNGTFYTENNGNGYGVLVGNNEPDNMYNFNSNTVRVSKSDFDVQSKGVTGSSYGINMGLDGNVATANLLVSQENNFNMNASGRKAWGLWMLNGSGALTSTNDSFVRSDKSPGGDGKILNPNGTVTPW